MLDGDADRRAVAVADDLERLDVARLREARPVAGGRAQELLVEVAADLDLRRVGLDDLDLALEELVDRDEARRLELDGGRRRLVAEDARDAAGGDERRAVRVAVVLVDVADRVRVDRARPDLLDDVEDPRDRRAPLAHARVLQRGVDEARLHELRRPPGLLGAVGHLASGLAAREREHGDLVPLGDVPEQEPADADLDVVGMRADGEHDLEPGGAALARDRDQRPRLLDQPGRLERLRQVVVGAGAQGGDGVVERAVAGEDEHGDLRLAELDPAHQLQPVDAGQLDVADHQVPVASGDDLRGLLGRSRSSGPPRGCRAAPRGAWLRLRRPRRGGCVPVRPWSRRLRTGCRMHIRRANGRAGTPPMSRPVIGRSLLGNERSRTMMFGCALPLSLPVSPSPAWAPSRRPRAHTAS